MLKKISYILIIVSIIFLGYLNYFKDEKGVAQVSNLIETSNVEYLSDGYKIKAKFQTENLVTKETKFKMAEVNYEEMFFKGDNVFIDISKNISIDENVYGKNSEGWEIFGDSIKYNQIKNLIESETGIKAENLKENLKISSEKFRTNKEFDFVDLRKNVKLKNNDIELSGDKGYYLSDNKIFNLSGNSRVESTTKDKEKIKGEFEKGSYNLNEKLLRIPENFLLKYGEINISGLNLWYNDSSKNMDIAAKAKITLKEKKLNKEIGKIESKKMNGNLNTMIFEFNEDVNSYFLSQDKETEQNITSRYSGNKLKVYMKKKLDGYEATKLEGRENSVLTRNNQKIFSDYMDVDLEKNEFYSDKNNKLVVNNRKDVTTLIGDKFIGDLSKEIFVAKGNINIESLDNENKKTIIVGNECKFDNKNNKIEIYGNARLENEDLVCTADRIEYDKNTEKIKAFGKTLVNYKSK